MGFRISRATGTTTGIALILTLLSGCGGGDDEPAAAAPAPAATVAPPPAAAPPPPVATTGTRAVTLTWAAPTQYENGSPFLNLAGYRIFYGNAPGSYSRLVESAPGTTTLKILDLASTTYYFSISAYNHEGVESTLSNEVAIRLN